MYIYYTYAYMRECPRSGSSAYCLPLSVKYTYICMRYICIYIYIYIYMSISIYIYLYIYIFIYTNISQYIYIYIDGFTDPFQIHTAPPS